MTSRRPTTQSLRSLVYHLTTSPWMSATPTSHRPKSFSGFFDEIERDHPRDPFHRQWTERVHTEMTAAGTWPLGAKAENPRIVAEYLSRLQRCFWQEIAALCNGKYQIDPRSRQKAIPAVNTLRIIYGRLERFGRRHYRDCFKLWSWSGDSTPKETTVHLPGTNTLIHVIPFTDDVRFDPVPFRSSPK
ncbi:MAG: hypothetical protein RJB39_553 [Candidatus Parcubacteria bacterium]|jgi:hypothetical protein